MQIGWATSRCRFSPEEGYGVGDDCVINDNRNNKQTDWRINYYLFYFRMDLLLTLTALLCGLMAQQFTRKAKSKLDVKLVM